MSIALLTIYLQTNNRSVVFVIYVIRIGKKNTAPSKGGSPCQSLKKFSHSLDNFVKTKK